MAKVDKGIALFAGWKISIPFAVNWQQEATDFFWAAVRTGSLIFPFMGRPVTN